MTQEHNVTSKNVLEKFEEGKKRFEALVLRRQRWQVELETSRRQFLEASRDAEAEFSTSKVAELRQLYRDREATKLQEVLEFLMGVDELEAELNDIEEKAA